MLTEEIQKTAAREILTIASLLLLAIAMKVCGGVGRLPFWWIAAGLYLARWVCWALTKGDRKAFRQSGLFLTFAIGVALVGGFALSIADMVTMLNGSHPVGITVVLLPLIGAAIGVVLMTWVLKRLGQDRPTQSDS